MRARSTFIAGLIGSILAPAVPGFGIVINPNDDTFITEEAPDTASGLGADLVSQARQQLDTHPGPAYKQTFVEFTIGSTSATSASFYINCRTARGAFVGIMYGKQWSFDEAGDQALTWNKFWGPDGYNTEGSWPSTFQGGAWNDADPNRIAQTSFDALNDGWERVSVDLKNVGIVAGLNSLDVTDFYNAHLGETVTLAFWGWAPINNNAVIWHSKETAAVDVSGPYLDVTEIPEPSMLALLALGTVVLRRRR